MRPYPLPPSPPRRPRPGLGLLDYVTFHRPASPSSRPASLPWRSYPGAAFSPLRPAMRFALLLLVVLLWAGCSSDEPAVSDAPRTFNNAAYGIAVTAPGYFREDPGLNPEAELKLSNRSREAYFLALAQRKTEVDTSLTLARFAELTLPNFTGPLEDAQAEKTGVTPSWALSCRAVRHHGRLPAKQPRRALPRHLCGRAAALHSACLVVHGGPVRRAGRGFSGPRAELPRGNRDGRRLRRSPNRRVARGVRVCVLGHGC